MRKRKIQLIFALVFAWSFGLQAQQDIIQGAAMATVDCGEIANYYDSGGAGCDITGNGAYGNNELTTTTICPGTAGTFIHVEFLDFDVETRFNPPCWDYLRVYDGPNTGSPLIFSGCGEEGFDVCAGGFPGDGSDGGNIEGGPNDMNASASMNPPNANNIFTSTDGSGCLTFNFDSDSSVDQGGWIAEVIAVDDQGVDCGAGPPPGGGGGTNACQILCPVDITVSTDPFDGQATCDAYVTIPQLEVTGDCDLQTIINDYNGSNDASDVYPLGETTVCFDILSLQGDPSQCCFTVTVEDNTPPVFVECPGNMIINLDAGECEAVLDFDIVALDECFEVQDFFEITNNNVFSEASLNNALGCGAGGYQFMSGYNLDAVGVSDLVIAEQVSFIIWNSINTPAVNVNVYEYSGPISQAGPLNYANMTLLATGSGTLPNHAGGAGNGLEAIIDLDVPTLLPQGGDIVVEVVATNSVFVDGFIGGSNSNGYIDGGSFYASSPCGVPQPVNPGSIGFPTINYMTKLYASPAITDPGLPIIADPGNQFNSGDAFPIGGPYCLLYTAFDEEGNSATCEFCVEVLEYPNPTGSLACNDHVNISLDENCEAIVGADDILEGGPYGCYDFYEVNLFFDAALTQPVPTSPLLTSQNVGQTLYVQVVDPNSNQGNSCWGTLFVEDKVIPDLECSQYDILCYQSTLPGAGIDFDAATAESVFPTIQTVDFQTISSEDR